MYFLYVLFFFFYLKINVSLTLIWLMVADIVVDNCAICRNHIMDLCVSFCLDFIFKLFFVRFMIVYFNLVVQVSSAKPTKPAPPVRNVLLLGGSATMHFTSTASADGSRLVKCAHWIIVSGSSKSMATRSFGPLPVEPSFLSRVLEDYTFLQLSLDSTGVALIF
ncbi:hypothetical protein CRYUN_Cryun33cG0072700 [Craigia yunnanensis]